MPGPSGRKALLIGRFTAPSPASVTREPFYRLREKRSRRRGALAHSLLAPLRGPPAARTRPRLQEITPTGHRQDRLRPSDPPSPTGSADPFLPPIAPAARTIRLRRSPPLLPSRRCPSRKLANRGASSLLASLTSTTPCLRQDKHQRLATEARGRQDGRHPRPSKMPQDPAHHIGIGQESEHNHRRLVIHDRLSSIRPLPVRRVAPVASPNGVTHTKAGRARIRMPSSWVSRTNSASGTGSRTGTRSPTRTSYPRRFWKRSSTSIAANTTSAR